MIYLDCNATTPLDPRVAAIVTHHLTEGFGNAGSRSHTRGSDARKVVQEARAILARCLDARPDEVLFTSGATEANNIALLGLAAHGEQTGRRHIVSTQIEHKAVLEPLEQLAARGFDVTLVPPEPSGQVSAAALLDALRPDTLLVSVMHVNNETGVIQPIAAVADGLADHDAYLHVDAAQGFGKVSDDGALTHPRVDLLSLSGHKLFAPQGVGALLARRRGYRRPPLTPLTFGGGQERGLRPGTLPHPLIAGFAEAARLAHEEAAERRQACLAFRARALDALAPLEPRLHGDPERCVPHTLNLSFAGLDSEAAMLALKHQLALSNGSACTSRSYTPSHVLTAMGLDDDAIQGALRLSWCHATPEPDWARVVETLRGLI